MLKSRILLGVLIVACSTRVVIGEPLNSTKVLGSQNCMTSGCHGGAGPDRGAYHIWKQYDPHFNAAATLSNGRSKAMAEQMGIDNAVESKSCTICHDPMREVNTAILVMPDKDHGVDTGVSCASCHGAGEEWLLSHTRPDYPKDALAQLGMRQLGSSYQRANNCVACHQNLSDELVAANHPPLLFELDGMLVAQPKHWREEEGFSNAQTWLVGQAVALREAAAQANREPGERREAEIEAIRALLRATGTGWNDSREDLVRIADDFAKRISAAPISSRQSRAMLHELIGNRDGFEPDAFGVLSEEYRMWAVGFYAERLALAIDRLNESLAASGQKRLIANDLLSELFDAAKPPKSFDAATVGTFVEKLNRLANSPPLAE